MDRDEYREAHWDELPVDDYSMRYFRRYRLMEDEDYEDEYDEYDY